MNQGILLAGNLIVDQIKRIETYPAEHNLTTITDESYSVGGLVCNCALDLARLDSQVPITAIGVVGDDEGGDFVLGTLGQHPSINLANVQRQGVTSYTDVMTTPDGGRTFFQNRGANAFLSPAHFDFTQLSGKVLHIGYALLLDTLDGPDSDYPTALCRVLDQAQKAGIQTSIDVVSEQSNRYQSIVAPALAYTDYCIVNEVEASGITGVALNGRGDIKDDNYRRALEALLQLGVGRWAIIHTPNFSCGMSTQDGKYIALPSWKIPEGFRISAVGAGDAFAATVLYGVYQDWDLTRCIDTAGAVASYSLSGEGASDAIKPLEEILEEMKAFQTA